jgi:hypothetical protein
MPGRYPALRRYFTAMVVIRPLPPEGGHVEEPDWSRISL